MNAERHVQAVRSALAELPPFWLEGRTVDDVVAWLRSRLGRGAFRLDIVAFGRGVAATKGEGTRRAYEVALNSFARHVGRDVVDVSEVTRAVAQEWADGLSAESAPGYVSKLRHVWEQARLRYNDEHNERVPASPFSRLALPVAVHRGQRSLGVEAMQRLIDARTDDPAERRALDWFVLSFGLMGMNYIDLLGAAPPRGGVLAYERRKTRSRRADGAEMRVRVPDCLGPFVARQRARGGRWWLRAPRDGNEQVLANAINGRWRGARSAGCRTPSSRTASITRRRACWTSTRSGTGARWTRPTRGCWRFSGGQRTEGVGRRSGPLLYQCDLIFDFRRATKAGSRGRSTRGRRVRARHRADSRE